MVGPRKNFIPLFLFCLCAILLYSYYHSSISISTPDPNPNFTLSSQNQNPNLPNFKFLIKVLVFNRLDAVSRCLKSLSNADYLGDRVNIHIYIDHFAHENGSAKVGQKLIESHRILEFVDGFDWKFGDKVVHYRTGNAGLQAQWLEAWWPSSDDEFAFVVEDDLEVSSLYYEFVKSLIVNFYYNTSNFSPSIYGISLQRPRFVPGKHGNKINLDSQRRLFLYQLVGTWGQILFPQPWKEFRLWYDKHKSHAIKPYLEGMVTTGWYKRMGERIWTPWFIKFIHSRGYFNIYTNFLHERALSVSHRDAGVNYGKTAGPDSKLLDDKSLDFNILEMQPLSNLRWYDFCFREVFPNRIIHNVKELSSFLDSREKKESITILSLSGVPETLARNLLCHFERLNIWNYVLLVPESSFLFDLARRGYQVINSDEFFSSIGLVKLSSPVNMESIKEILVKAYILKKCVEDRHNAWLLDGNVLLFDHDLLLQSADPAFDFFFAKNAGFVYARASPTSMKVWADDFISRVASMPDSSIRTAPSQNHQQFVSIISKLLEQDNAKVKSIDVNGLGVAIGIDTVNQSLDHKAMVYWPSSTSLDLIQKGLSDMNLWIVDDDGSCIAVICHKT